MNKLIDYYCNYDENGRLLKDNAHKIEWLTTLKYLNKYIPAGSKIIDCCAGTGRYSFWLAENGFEVTAGDLIPKHIDYIKSDKRSSLLKNIIICNVLDLSDINSESFDVVLCMGAYYHLHEKAEREKAVAECLRILKNGGLLVLAYINRNAAFLTHFKNNPTETIENDIIIYNGKNGVFYAADFGEIKQLSNQFHLEEIADVGIDGLSYPLMKEINSLDELHFKKYMDYHFATCEIPSIIGNSIHGLYFTKKRTEY